MEFAGDDRTLIALKRNFRDARCLYCDSTGHSHARCPKRPCYTCGFEGHLATDCPHRRRPIVQNLLDAAADAGAKAALARVLAYTRHAELGHTKEIPPSVPSPQLRARIQASYDRAHEKRITALEWLPRGRRILSADKRGVVALTDIGAAAGNGLFEPRIAYGQIHSVNVTGFAFESEEIVVSGSLDGKVKRSHVEFTLPGAVGADGNTAKEPVPVTVNDTLLNLNPNGWTTVSEWRSVTAIAMGNGAAYATTCRGSVYTLDPRGSRPMDVQHKLHCEKISSVDVNPIQQNLLVTSSNDRVMSLWDARMLKQHGEIARYAYPKCLYGASFSPNTGSSLVSTAHDNRVRIWRDINVLVGDAHERESAKPVEIVHSCNFARYLAPFKPYWDPKDWRDDTFMVGRFLGDAYRFGEKEEVLYPIDVFSVSRGEVVGELVDMNVNRFSPTEDIIATGTSFHLMFWAPNNPNRRNQDQRPSRSNGLDSDGGNGNDNDDGGDDDNDDHGDGGGPRKKKKIVVTKKKSTTTRRATRSSTLG